MLTPCDSTARITTEKIVVVAGGTAGDDLNTAEVICPLPQKQYSFSGIVCGNSIYLAGGFTGRSWSKSVFTCSLPELWQPMDLGYDGHLLGQIYGKKLAVYQ